MNDLPEFPPSELICTPYEWGQAFQRGREAHQRGQLCIPPKGKYEEPWRHGWQNEQKRTTN